MLIRHDKRWKSVNSMHLKFWEKIRKVNDHRFLTCRLVVEAKSAASSSNWRGKLSIHMNTQAMMSQLALMPGLPIRPQDCRQDRHQAKQMIRKKKSSYQGRSRFKLYDRSLIIPKLRKRLKRTHTVNSDLQKILLYLFLKSRNSNQRLSSALLSRSKSLLPKASWQVIAARSGQEGSKGCLTRYRDENIMK
jgi:hypothetical protein